MGFSDFIRGITMARDQLDSLVYGVVFELVEKQAWTESRAEEFCFKNKTNRNRIVHMRQVLRQSAADVAKQIHAGAVASGFDIR